MGAPSRYRREKIIARITGAHIRERDFNKPSKPQRDRTIYKYRHIFQMLLLGYKYSHISKVTGLTESHLSMLVIRYASKSADKLESNYSEFGGAF